MAESVDEPPSTELLDNLAEVEGVADELAIVEDELPLMDDELMAGELELASIELGALVEVLWKLVIGLIVVAEELGSPDEELAGADEDPIWEELLAMTLVEVREPEILEPLLVMLELP